VVVVKLKYLAILRASQYLNEMIHPEALTGSIDYTKSLLCRLGTIPGIYGLEAGITIPAGLRQWLAKIIQQALPAACGDLA
jgi:hypothetical protein